MLADVRAALRNLRHEPGYAAAATLTLALTIGATTAIFSGVHKVLLDTAGITDPRSLVMAWSRDTARQLGVVELSYRNVEDWAKNTRSFTSLAAIGSSTWPAILDGRGDPERLSLAGVSVSFLDTLGVRPLGWPRFRGGRRSAERAARRHHELRHVGGALRQRSRGCRPHDHAR